VCLAVAALSPRVPAQEAPPRAILTLSETPPPAPRQEILPVMPTPSGTSSRAGANDLAVTVMPINLATALRLAQTNNLEIAQAQEVVNRARATLDKARVLILPSVNLGSTYTEHEGNIAKTEGNII